MLYGTFAQAERIGATRLLMVRALLARALGAVLGGVIVDGLSWRWIFYVNVRVGVAALTFGAAFLPQHGEHATGRFDLRGLVLVGVGFPLVMYARQRGSQPGLGVTQASWPPSWPGWLCSRPLRGWSCARPNGCSGCASWATGCSGPRAWRAAVGSAGFIGTLFLVPLFLQNGLGYSALHPGCPPSPKRWAA